LNSQSTPAAATQGEPNLQNVNPNVIHSSSHGSTTSASSNASSSSSSHHHIASPPAALANANNNGSSSSNSKSQVITQNIHTKTTSGGGGSSSSSSVNMKDDRQQQQQADVVSLSANSVPGVQLPTNNSSCSNSASNNPSVSTIVNANQVQMQTTSPTMSVSVSSSSIASHGSLYQHLTNNQTGNQTRERVSPLMPPHHHQGRASPITPAASLLLNDGHGSSNHTSVLQNMNSSSSSVAPLAGVISSAGFHGPNAQIEPSPAMLKVQYEKQSPASRIHALQQEEISVSSGRRSRYVETCKLSFMCFFPLIIL
jgi:hypothetical protein